MLLPSTAVVLAAGCEQEDAEDVDRSCKALQSGEACTWAGLALDEGFNGDGLHRRKTLVSQPQDLLFMPDGTAWFTDFNNFLIRRVLTDDTVETMVGSQDPIFPGDGPLTGVAPGGADGSEWMLNHPTNLVPAPDGSLLVVAWHNHKLLTVDPDDGHVTVMCGGGAGFAGDGGPATGALFKQVNDATVDEAGNIYLVDQQNQRIRQIDANGDIDTIAGAGSRGYSGDGGPALEAEFSWAVGSNPNPSGGIVHHQGKLYISDTEADVIRVMDLGSGQIDAFAGTGEEGDGGDGGPALQARLSAPRDLEIGPDGRLYFADTDNGRVRAIDLDSGIIDTVVGTGELGLGEDGLPATETQLRRPFGIAFDPDGNLYVMDTLNSRIVKVAR
ncbi:NHL domain-containing protein [Paraliomyxa miuraensis]|uniref:NHL domain-containing protein n=1 Tax=Paraliomyxa miuraensis TaxID=376150 RepID=UPI00224EA54A|nr:SMP-30/gluconolactonase/LRE family protein [Paraliomyxa miuraensis]MCX4241355.1 SMP-30/gluconolactonase/LRE family protein [Paraliomyxa miuraensis]